VSKIDQYRSKAAGWSDREYADAGSYLRHRADLVVSLGPRLEEGDEVLDLACGDGGLGAVLLARGFRYRGVDVTPEMVDAARRRLGDAAPVETGDLNDYVPPGPVAATTLFRAVYYARDRASFFAHVAGFTRHKLVFDLNPRQYRVADVVDDLRRAGFPDVSLHPFFVPQRVALPGPVLPLAYALERSGPLATLALRFRFTYLVAAARGT
jgi:SAM-dependent methyltransferase